VQPQPFLTGRGAPTPPSFRHTDGRVLAEPSNNTKKRGAGQCFHDREDKNRAAGTSLPLCIWIFSCWVQPWPHPRVAATPSTGMGFAPFSVQNPKLATQFIYTGQFIAIAHTGTVQKRSLFLLTLHASPLTLVSIVMTNQHSRVSPSIVAC